MFLNGKDFSFKYHNRYQLGYHSRGVWQGFGIHINEEKNFLVENRKVRVFIVSNCWKNIMNFDITLIFLY